jgi:hypothetical protein
MSGSLEGESELILRGRQILKELQGADGLLEQWMAHYLAELMARYELEGSDPASPLAEKCARIIVRLWELEVERAFAEVQYQLTQWGREVKPDQERYRELGQALAAPGAGGIPSLDEGGALTVWDLAKLERLVVRAWQLAESLRAAEESTREEVTQRLLSPELEVRRVRDALQEAFPAFQTLDFADVDAVKRASGAAFMSIQVYRCNLVFGRAAGETEESSGEVEP